MPYSDQKMKENNSIFIPICFSAVLLLLLAYSNHFHNSFHFDDHHTIVDNDFIKDIKNIPLFFTDARTQSSLPANQTYRPLTSATHAVDYWMGKGMKTTLYFHLSTFIWFASQCMLLVFFFDKIISTTGNHRWNRCIALFAAGWYALHTVNAETINYIYQRADVLSTFMVIAGFILYIYLPKWRRRGIYLIPVFIGMFIKEPTAMFAPLLFFYIMLFEEKLPLGEGLKPKNLLKVLKSSAPAFLLCLILIVFVVRMMSVTWTPGGNSRVAYFITQPFVVLRYFTTFFLPLDLSADADWKVMNSILDIRVAAGFLFVSVMLYLAYFTSKNPDTRPISFGILWFFIALIPTSSVIPLAEVMNDHRMFFPYIGLMLAVCWTLGLFVIKNETVLVRTPVLKAVLIILASGILAGHAYGTYQRNEVWRSEESLWNDVTLKSPGNGRGLMNYGLTQMEKGDFENASMYFEKALVLNPTYSYLHINIAILKAAMNQPEAAESFFKSALKLDPNNPEGFYYYAKWLSSRKRVEEATTLLQQAIGISPGHGSANSLMKDILARKKPSLQPPTEQTETADKLSTAEDYLSLSLKYNNDGRYPESIRACTEALKINPDYDLAFNNICAAYNALGQLEKAIDACENGIRINPHNPYLNNNLALARHRMALSPPESR